MRETNVASGTGQCDEAPPDGGRSEQPLDGHVGTVRNREFKGPAWASLHCGFTVLGSWWLWKSRGCWPWAVRMAAGHGGRRGDKKSSTIRKRYWGHGLLMVVENGGGGGCHAATHWRSAPAGRHGVSTRRHAAEEAVLAVRANPPAVSSPAGKPTTYPCPLTGLRGLFFWFF